MHALGIALRRFRTRAGYTQKELAEISGCGDAYLSRIENGTCRPTSARLLDSLADALQLTNAEREALHKAAADSQRIIRLPSNSGQQRLNVMHDLARLLKAAKDEDLKRIEAFLQDELARSSHQ